MAKHEFGIMETAPVSGKRYDEYEPEKYSCISIDDDYIECIQEQLDVFDSYCHTLDIPMKGLNYIMIYLLNIVTRASKNVKKKRRWLGKEINNFIKILDILRIICYDI